MSKPKLTITFGAMAPKLRAQISAAGFIAHYGDVAEWQKDADAIVRLSVRGLLSGSGGSDEPEKINKSHYWRRSTEMKALTITGLILLLFVPGIRRLLKARKPKGDFTSAWRANEMVDYEQDQKQKAMIY